MAPQYLIGYGTLLLRASLGTSIGQGKAAEKAMLPVVVEGYRRVFNIRPDHYTPSKKLMRGEEAAAMNVEEAAGQRVNGVAFTTTLEDLAALDQREACYERHVVAVRAFEDGSVLGEGHIYVGCEPWITRDPDRLMPLWRDVVWGRTGAYQLSEAFGAFFDETTFLGDGTTRVLDVYRDLLADTSDVPPPPPPDR
jgi:hypothetical protein